MTAAPRPRMTRARRREQLLDVALDTVVTSGFGALTMEGLARAAGIAKTVVYRQFGTVDELARVLLRRERDIATRVIVDAIPGPHDEVDPETAIIAPLESLLASVRERPNTWRLVLFSVDGAPPAFRCELDRHRRTVVEQMSRYLGPMLAVAGAPVDDVELFTQSLLASTENAVRLHLTDPAAFPASRITAYMRQMVAGRPAPADR